MVETSAARRTVASLSVLGLVALTACTPPAGRVSSEPAVPQVSLPNIVVIVTDDQRADTLRWLPTVQRRLVRRGTTFSNAFVTTPTCCPSRASLLTGLLPGGTGVWRNGGEVHGRSIGGWPAYAAAGMEERSVATWLAPTHETILVGKYLNHYERVTAGSPPAGWDVWHSFVGVNGAYLGYDLLHTDGSVTHHGRRPHAYSTDVFADLAVRSIERTDHSEPLFLYFAPYAPHGPLTPAPRDRRATAHVSPYRSPSLNEPDMDDKPPWMRGLRPLDVPRLEEHRRTTKLTLRAVDDAVQRLLGALRRTNRLANTLIVFTSDNGSSWGEHRVPLANKYLPYDAQSHVPLVMRWDRHVASGEEDDRLTLNVDVPVTVASAAGIRPPEVDGRSLLEPRGRGGILLAATRSFGGHGDGLAFARPAYCAYRTARSLFVRYASGHEELYDLRADRHELVNLADSRRMEERTGRLRQRTRSACRPQPPGFSWR